MIDKLVIGWCDRAHCGRQRHAAQLVADLTNGRNLRGERVARGFYWERAGDRRVRLRCNGCADDFMICMITFDRYASPSGLLGMDGRLDINPTRLLAHLGGQSLEGWFGSCRAGQRAVNPDPHDNVLPIDAAAPVRPEYFWCDLAADIADRFLGIVMAGLTGDRVHRPPAVWLGQAEAYWEFGISTPICATEEVEPAITACAGATHGYYERVDDLGLPVLGLSLASANSRRLALYPRDARLRVEVRYLRSVARHAKGSGSGNLRHRLRCVAADAALHVNRALRATRNYRRQSALHRFGSLAEFYQRITSTLSGSSDRIARFAQDLLRNRYVRAGDRRGCTISLNEAQRLERAGVLARRSIRTRDYGGRIYALESYFEGLSRHP